MNRGPVAALVAAALMIGIGLGGVLASLTGSAATVTATLVTTVTRSLPGHTAVPVTVTLEKTVTVTTTVPRTVTVTWRPPATTVTVTATTTVTQPPSTITETAVYTVTVTKTVTVTTTVTATTPFVSTPPEYIVSTPVQAQGYLAAATAPPSLPGAVAAEAGGLRLRLGNGLLVVERDTGIGSIVDIQQVVTDDNGNALAYLAPVELEGGNVLAVYSRITPRGFLAAYRVSDIESVLPGPGSYRLYDFASGVECVLQLGATGLSVEGCSVARATPGPATPVGDEYDTIVAALANALTPEEVGLVASTVAAELALEEGSSPDALLARLQGDPAEAAWMTLYFMDTRFTYNTTKQELGGPVYGPIKMLKTRSGVCSDYAVFGAALLLNLTGEAYVVTMFTPGGPHAVAAAGLEDRLYVLDQHLPPVELQDYLEYVAPGAQGLRLYRVTPGPIVEVFPLNPGIVDDGYPADRVDPAAVEEARQLHAAETGLRPYQGLEALLEPLGLGPWLETYLPRLGGAVESLEKPVGLGRAYAPVFKHQWARMLAGYMDELRSLYYNDTTSGSFWAIVDEEADVTIIRYIAAAVPPVNASLTVRSGKLIYSLDLPPGVDPVQDVQLLVYQPGESSPCAAIAPPGYSYTSVPYIEADSWTVNGNRLEVVIDEAALRSLVSSCTTPVLIAWIDDNTADAKPLG